MPARETRVTSVPRTTRKMSHAGNDIRATFQGAERVGMSKDERQKHGQIHEEVQFDPMLRRMVEQKEDFEDKIKAYEKQSLDYQLRSITRGSPFRLKLCTTVEGNAYQALIAVVTLFSCVTVVLETDWRSMHSASDSGPKDLGYLILSYVVLTVYCTDIVLRVVGYGHHFFFSAYSFLDLSILGVDIIMEAWPDLPSTLSVLKTTRFLRLGRVLRSITQFRDLYLMMQGIASSIRAVIFGSLLVFTILTFFSVLSVHFLKPINKDLAERGVFADCAWCEEAFDSVMKANMTFLATAVISDCWLSFALPLCLSST
eukprot:TRINITY_DN10882_c1_g2_i1.p1 TRINITY_DN10882_c1_g2~~TRINITY_DN10882_c1_g2_i1.p1  ORF type:complete len:314 (+),score=27.09 TRINITY_DN10882_c1_g2_i1:89-1030(+)